MKALSPHLQGPACTDGSCIDGSCHLALLAQAMDALPLGVTISDGRSGDCIYENRAAAALGPKSVVDGVGVSRRELARSGRTYDLTTFTDLSEQRAKEERLVQMAFFDDLTGLPKSALMQETVDGMIADAVPSFALSFIDVDNFKFVNDYYGHDIGDQLLRKVTQRIAENCRASDLLARVGGDEFILLTVPTDAGDETAQGIERLSSRLRAPFFIEGFEIFSSVSIGVSVYPLHGGSYETLRANADRAMYRTKECAKGGVKLFDASLNEAATARMESEQRLRLTVRDRSFVCAFQPKVDFWDGTIVGIEVLLRWRDGNGVLHPPGDLIKLAIELGLMGEITMIIVDQVIDQIDQIDEMFGRHTSISINIAAKQAGDLPFMRKLVETLSGTEHTKRFILELTEEAFFSKGEFQRNILPLLRARGLGVSIDDFGVGYSSLSALAEIAADEVKVDRSFISQIHLKQRSQTILKVIEMLARELGMRIVVEGVETAEELDYLRAHTQIRCGQGFLFARPMLLRGQATPVRGERHGHSCAPARAAGQRR